MLVSSRFWMTRSWSSSLQSVLHHEDSLEYLSLTLDHSHPHSEYRGHPRHINLHALRAGCVELIITKAGLTRC